MGSARKEGGSIHLTFEMISPKKGNKLPSWKVINDQFHEEIGLIRWRGGWRQFVFTALPDIDMSRSCQKEIIVFIDKIMKSWRSQEFQDNRNRGWDYGSIM